MEELFIPPECLDEPHGFLWYSFCSIFSFLCIFFHISVFVLFLLAIIHSFLFWFTVSDYLLKTHNLNDHTKQHYKWRTSNNCKSNKNSTQASLYLFLNLLNDNSVSLCIDCLLASFSLDIFSSFHWKKLHSLRSLKAEQA